MKTKQNVITGIIILLFIVVGTTIFVSCSRDESTMQNPNSIKIDAEIFKMTSDIDKQVELQFMKDVLKISPKNVRISDEEYTIEGDMFMTRQQVQEAMKYEKIKQESINSLGKHRKHDYMSTVGAKKIYCHSGVPSAWSTAISDACALYNTLGLTVSFSKLSTTNTTNTNALTVIMGVSSDFTPGDVAKTALPGSNLAIGYQMRINSAYNSLSASQKKFIVAHEIAHALGFRHTDSGDGTPINSWQYSCVPFSCDGVDASSVFRAGSSPIPSWTSFSYCDQQVLQCIYGV